MKNIKLTVAYDGSHFLGWQNNKMGSSVEETLACVLEQILQQKVALQAASRTDSGVHARGQIVNFFLEKDTDLKKLLVSINSLLPSEVAVVNISIEKEDFHPSLHSRSKEYRYYICNSSWQYPEYRFTSWHCPHPLHVEKMRAAAEYLIGEHDFSAFCNVKKNEFYEHCIRTIHAISIEEIHNNRISITVKGNKFLYKMVRNIVGTLVYVGNGKFSVEDVKSILEEKKRTEAGVTAPAHGLFLHQINY